MSVPSPVAAGDDEARDLHLLLDEGHDAVDREGGDAYRPVTAR
jgi:hypothetical protein